MARRRSSKKHTGRDVSTIANVNPYSVLSALSRTLPRLPAPLSLLEDRRSFHPARSARPAFALRRDAARLVAREPARRPGRQTKATIAFADPKRVVICMRRGVRKEVMFALGRTGRGGKRNRRPRRSSFSSVSCR